MQTSYRYSLIPNIRLLVNSSNWPESDKDILGCGYTPSYDIVAFVCFFLCLFNMRVALTSIDDVEAIKNSCCEAVAI